MAFIHFLHASNWVEYMLALLTYSLLSSISQLGAKMDDDVASFNHSSIHPSLHPPFPTTTRPRLAVSWLLRERSMSSSESLRPKFIRRSIQWIQFATNTTEFCSLFLSFHLSFLVDSFASVGEKMMDSLSSKEGASSIPRNSESRRKINCFWIGGGNNNNISFSRFPLFSSKTPSFSFPRSTLVFLIKTSFDRVKVP